MARLAGLLVVSVEQAVAAPLCSCRLADGGARVIKIERAEGDFARGYDAAVHGESAYFVWLNRGKESVVLDLKADSDKALLHRLIARADVFIQNLIPGAAARAGFDPQELRRRRPRLITCSISGYGDSGPYSDRKAYDLLIQAESGLASITGSPEAPGRVGVSLSDIVCGLNAHAAILEALYRRECTGEGAGISLSLFDATAETMAVPLLQHDYAGRPPRRLGLAHPSIAPYGVFETADGRPLLIGIQNEREWRELCSVVLQQPALVDDPRFRSNNERVANRQVLDAIVAAACRRHDYAALIDLLQAAGIAFGAVNDVAGLSTHPHLRRMAVTTPTGEARLPAPPAIFADEQPTPAAVPALGQHTHAIRREFAPVSFDIGEAAALLGRAETRTADAHPEPAQLLRATLDRDIGSLEAGAPLPLLWHWLYFPPLIRQSRLGEDGHTRDSGLLPVIPFLPRRMWAGSRLRSEAPLRIGDRLTRRSEVVSLTPKIGGSGRLLFITLRHTLAGSGGGGVVEEQDIVLREPAGRSTSPGNSAAPVPFEFEHVVTPTPTLLFRFSALTFNAHRIHYDHPYATEVEGYEGLVVHGPLMAVLMLDLVDRVRPGAFVSAFDFKAVNPAFVPHPLAVRATASASDFALRVESAGRIASSGTATAPAPQ